jgi:cardiolipin synthase
MLIDVFIEDLNWTIYAIDAMLVALIVILEWQDPRKTLFWALILLITPLVGFICYLILGQSFYSKHAFRLRDKDEKLYHQKQKAMSGDPLPIDDEDVAKALESMGSVLTYGNEVKLYTEGNAKFEDLKRDIEAAKEYIHVEYYIIRSDTLGDEILELLEKKAREGVEVRLMVDALGIKTGRLVFNKLKNSGAKVTLFHSLATCLFSPKKNNRNHRKIAVMDGKVAYVGGFNIGDEYLGKGKLGYWRDSAVRIEGPAVSGVIYRFNVDWKYAFKEDLFTEKYECRSEPKGDVAMQIASGGPDMHENSEIGFQYLMMIEKADKTLYIHTPYFAPNETYSSALRAAAMRGVDVRVIIPDKPDHPFVYWANRKFADDVMKSGVRVFEYNRGFVHSKTVVVDGSLCSVGSANFDDRSMRLNFETNAVIYSDRIGKQMEDAFMEDLGYCTEYSHEKYASLGIFQKFATKISWFFSGQM